MRYTLAVLLIAAGCDGTIHESGIVIDAKTHQPIAGAKVWFGDRVMNQGLGSYLDKKTASPGPPAGLTDDKGAFTVSEMLAGPGDHDVWIMVRAPDHVELRKPIWKGVGMHPAAAAPIEIALEPAP
jgi:hypothetical protein